MREIDLVGEYEFFDGVQRLYYFENMKGASVVRHKGSYGGKKGLWELVKLEYEADEDGDLRYNMKGDVHGYLTEEEVDKLLAEIEGE